MNMRYTKIINFTKILSIKLANRPLSSPINFNKALKNRLTNTPSYQYSTLPPKIQRKAQKRQIESGVQKVIKQLDNLKKHEQLRQQHLKIGLALIEKSTLSAPEKLSCKKYMTSIIYHKNQPTQFLLQSQTMKQIHKDQPFMQVETYLYIISREQSKQAPNYMLINDLYMKCFEDVLKKALGDEKWKIESLLYKNFGKYMIEKGNKDKGCQALQKSIDSHISLIKSEQSKITQYISQITQKTEQNSLKQKPQKQHEILKLNAMKQNTRRLIQSMYETLHYYYNYKKYKLKDLLKVEQQELLITFISLFTDVFKCSIIVQGSRLYSRHYHRLRQVYFQLEYAYALGRSDQERKRDIMQKMNGFIKQCMNDVQETKDYVQVQKNIVSAMFSIKLHLSRQERGKNTQAIKKDLTDMAITIIQKSSLSQSKITKQVILKILAQFIKKNLS